MKHTFFHCALLAGLMVTGSASAQDTAHINFVGTINGPTCSLSTSNITIPLGAVNKSVFTAVGSPSPWGPNVALVSAGCNASLVSMTFTGAANSSNPNLFAVTGGAAGVGIQLQQSNTSGGAGGGQAIPNDTTNPVTFAPAAAGAGYSFTARYVQSDATITTGPANATITVLITYT
ncbi:fimbrial protein [Dyella psychrodurans]|nr:fimbrial protein [Dyella psychrodurans]